MRVIARCAALALFVAGCSTPLAPPAKESASSQRLLRLPERTVEARFVGSTVRLDRNFQPKLQRHVVFEVHEWHEGQPITDTVATGSSLEQVKWPILSAQHLPRLSPDEPVGSPSESAKDTGQVFARIAARPIAGADRSRHLLVLAQAVSLPPQPDEPAGIDAVKRGKGKSRRGG